MSLSGFGIIRVIVLVSINSVTNCHKLSGLKQWNLLSYSSGVQKSKLGQNRLTSGYQQSCVSFWRIWGAFVSLSFLTARGHTPGLLVPFPFFKASDIVSLWPSAVIVPLSDHSQKNFSAFKDSFDSIARTWVIQDDLSISSPDPQSHLQVPEAVLIICVFLGISRNLSNSCKLSNFTDIRF